MDSLFHHTPPTITVLWSKSALDHASTAASLALTHGHSLSPLPSDANRCQYLGTPCLPPSVVDDLARTAIHRRDPLSFAGPASRASQR